MYSFNHTISPNLGIMSGSACLQTSFPAHASKAVHDLCAQQHQPHTIILGGGSRHVSDHETYAGETKNTQTHSVRTTLFCCNRQELAAFSHAELMALKKMRLGRMPRLSTMAKSCESVRRQCKN